MSNIKQIYSINCNRNFIFYFYSSAVYLGDNCNVFENFTASIGDLMLENWVYWQRDSGTSKRIFVTIKSTIDAMKFSNTIQLSQF
jgi:hypothetical protein